MSPFDSMHDDMAAWLAAPDEDTARDARRRIRERLQLRVGPRRPRVWEFPAEPALTGFIDAKAEWAM